MSCQIISRKLNLYHILLFQDLATHTRITPEKRHQVMLRYLDTIRSNPEALAELTNWGIQLDNDILPVSHKKKQGKSEEKGGFLPEKARHLSLS